MKDTINNQDVKAYITDQADNYDWSTPQDRQKYIDRMFEQLKNVATWSDSSHSHHVYIGERTWNNAETRALKGIK
jgi:hypothetical protein